MDDPARRILEEISLGVWVGEAPDARSSYANRAFREILGMGPVESSRVGDVPTTYHVFDRAGRPYPVERLPFCRVLATGASVVVDDMVIHRPDGAHVAIRAFGQPLKDSGGRITHVILAFIDISREAAAEAERATMEARLKLAVDNAPIVLYSVDARGMVTMCEGAGLTSMGLRPADFLGRSVLQLYGDHPSIPGLFHRALAGESLYATVQVGEAVYDTWMRPLRAPDGTVSGVMGVSHDMSEVRRLQAAAIHNDRVMAMGTLAASVAHEINNPLTYVLHHLEGLRDGLDRHIGALGMLDDSAAAQAARVSAAQMLEDLTPTYQGIHRIATIVRDLRSFSRPDDSRLSPIDVRTVIGSVLSLVRKDVEVRARLVVSLPEEAIAVVASETRLVQVLMNLLMNAQKSLPEGSPDRHEIAVSARQQGDRAVIEVSDTGPGVSPADRERVFEPFVTLRPAVNSTGLGLFVSRHIVRGLGGDISVGDRPGGGAIFRVQLPAAGGQPTGAPAPAPGPPAPAAQTAARVLVIDDEPLVARALVGQLISGGFEAQASTDVTSASALLLGDARFDLIYCDLMMKGMTGMDLADLLAARAPHRLPRVVFMTGGAFTQRAADFVAAHPDTCVEKPFSIVRETHRRLRHRL